MNLQKEAVSTRKSLSRIVLQVFVWALVIAFVSTLGVMWDGSAGGFPVVVSSSKGKVDLSPRDLYMQEYDRLYAELSEQAQDADPREFSHYVRNVSLTNTANIFGKQLFYNDIRLKPSPKRFQEVQGNTGLVSNLVDYQYADFQYTFPLGVLPILAAPTVSDMYAIGDLQQLQIASELLVLNKTNFLVAQVTDEEIQDYYIKNFEKWLDTITIQEIQVEDRGQGRRVINLLKSQDQDSVFSQLAESNDIVITKDKTITVNVSNHTYVNEILLSFKSNQNIVGPIYDKGEYSVVVITNIHSLETLQPAIRHKVMLDFITENYDTLAKKYSTEWKNTINMFKVDNEASYSTVAEQVDSVIHHTLQPFLVLQSITTNVLGVPLNLPLLSNPDILKGFLYTPLNTTSDMISVQDELYMYIRPLLRDYKKLVTEEHIFDDPRLFQNVAQYKDIKLKEMLNSNLLKNKYKIKLHPQALTNLN